MPKRRDLKKILVIGAGPIVIGQACEFDYSGTQACKALKEEGYKVILINSNPATIMTDPEIADKTYIEPITTKILESIIRKEKPCAILSTMGGQTALNVTMQLEKKGLLKKYKVELIGANSKAISNAEDRKKFRKCMEEINIDLPKSEIVTSIKKAKKALEKIGLPAIIRPAFTLGGSGGGMAYKCRKKPNAIRSNCLTHWADCQVQCHVSSENLEHFKDFSGLNFRNHAEIPKIVPHIEAILRVHYHNYTDKINTVNRIVFPIEGADFYYRKNEAYYNDIELIINHKLMQTVTEIDVVNAEWIGKRTNLKQKFDGKYVMEWGF